jgi:hypothetical protein
MLRPALLISALLILPLYMTAQDQTNKNGVPVEVVATASEYVPRSTTVSHPGHAYKDCLGSTSYLGEFDGYGYSGTVSGTAQTNTSCTSTFSPPGETTLTTYRRVNYTIAKDGQGLYLLSCTQEWKPSLKGRSLAAFMAALEGAGHRESGKPEAIKNAHGAWTECPAFSIGAKYTLTVNNTSDARLENSTGVKSIKLEYLSSARRSLQSTPTPTQAQVAGTTGEAKVHITSSPSGGEIYIDGKFFGNTPSDITLPAGEHSVKVTLGGKEWTRSVHITTGEIRLNADLAEK